MPLINTGKPALLPKGRSGGTDLPRRSAEGEGGWEPDGGNADAAMIDSFEHSDGTPAPHRVGEDGSSRFGGDVMQRVENRANAVECRRHRRRVDRCRAVSQPAAAA